MGDQYGQLRQALILARRARGWTQRDLAWRMGSKQARVSLYESGKLLPQLPTLLRWLDVLEVRMQAWVPMGSSGQTTLIELGKVWGGHPDR